MKGIIFKPDMIKAIVEGRKTITRRLEGLREINHEPDIWVYRYFENGYSVFEGIGLEIWARAKPRYQVGEVVYIKEALGIGKLPNILTGEPTNIDTAKYLLDGEPVTEEAGFDVSPWWKGKILSPLFMPAWAARYFIKITDVRAERLQEITLEGMQAEGEPYMLLPEGKLLNFGYTKPYNYIREHFAWCWDSINPKYPWASNPWCFVYTFQLVDKKK